MNTNSFLLDLSPQTDLGLPKKFTSLRPAQADAIEWAAYETQTAKTAMSLPTGAGKSGIAVGLANLLGVKAVYLVGSRGLQDQVGTEMSEIGMVDVRGKQNYTCTYLNKGMKVPKWTCADGADEDCPEIVTGRCGHTKAITKGTESRLALSNYPCWLKNRQYNQGFLGQEDMDDPGPVRLLICDEAHSLPAIIGDHLKVEVRHNDELLPVDGKRPMTGDKDWPAGLMPAPVWSTWAVERLISLKAEQSRMVDTQPNTAMGAALARKDDRYRYLEELKGKCNQISKMDANWVWQAGPSGVVFEPIWPGKYTGVLWSGIDRVLLLSATLRPYTMGLLGLGAGTYDFREWPAVFQPGRSPVYHIPTVKLTYRSTDNDYANIVARMDEIISGRQDRKGIVHSVSYGRARRIVEASTFRAKMLFNENGKDAASVASKFRQAPPGTVLVSPSYSTGWDFPGTDAEYQVVLKVPFPDTSSRVMKERCKSGDYRMYCAVQDLVQMCGRGMRHAQDRCENFVIDDSVGWARGKGDWHGFAPSHFKVHTVGKVPAPAPKL